MSLVKEIKRLRNKNSIFLTELLSDVSQDVDTDVYDYYNDDDILIFMYLPKSKNIVLSTYTKNTINTNLNKTYTDVYHIIEKCIKNKFKEILEINSIQ